MWRRTLTVAAVGLLVLAALTVAIAAQGSRRTWDRSDRPPPAWAKPCLERPPREDRPLLHDCAQVRGRILHVGRSPTNELHLAVLAHWHLMVVKLPDDAERPGVGSMRTFVGPLVRVRHHLEEVQAFRVE